MITAEEVIQISLDAKEEIAKKLLADTLIAIKKEAELGSECYDLYRATPRLINELKSLNFKIVEWGDRHGKYKKVFWGSADYDKYSRLL